MAEQKIFSPNRIYLSPRYILILILILVAVGSVLGVYLLVKQGNLTIRTPVPQNQGLPLADSLDTCAIKKEGNPLVSDVTTIPGKKFIVGTFLGNIDKVDYNTQTQTAEIKLMSPKGDQDHTFTVKAEKGLITDAKTRGELQLSDLARGQTATLSFNCDLEKESKNRIVNILISNK